MPTDMHSPRRIVDLTHTLSEDIPSFDGDCCFRLHTAVDYQDCTAPNLFRVQKIEAKAGCGTHMDAPLHCFPDGKAIDELDLRHLLTECFVMHLSGTVDEHTVITPETILAFEKIHGMITPESFVIFHTGWDVHWGNAEKYRNRLRFPCVHAESAELLLERNVAGMGIDTLSPDAGGVDYPVHRVILGAGKYLVENVANAKEVPPTGAKISVMPIKIKNGTEAPVRLVAMLP